MDALLRSLRARRGYQRALLPVADLPDPKLLRNILVAHSRRFIPALECLEDRNLLTTVSPGVHLLGQSLVSPATSGGLPSGFNPAQIRQAYGFNQITFNNGAVVGDGSGQTIAIVDAYDQPNIANDLAVFDSTFGIAAPPSFTKVNENGGSSMPSAVASWGLEESLDVEWAHAIAPGAKIVLVEASSPNVTDLLAAVNYARNVPGVAVVSMSFGGSEWSGEASYDAYFTTPGGHQGVTFVASSGDSGSSGAPEWPSVSPNVLAVGGTQLSTNGSGNYIGEIGWSGSGGGISQFESQPSFQNGVVTQTSARRTVPDVAYDGSSNSPFAIYDTSSYSGWLEVYGTSCGAPQWSALIAIADQGRVLNGKTSLDGPTQTLSMIYALPSADFHDITSGNNGGYSAGSGYDLVTGRGSPHADLVVNNLVGPTLPPAKATFTSLASSTNPSVYGQSVTFIANVFGSGGTPSGEVAFLDGGVMLGEGTLNYGTAVLTTGSLPPGGALITAVYEGDQTFASSTSFSQFELVFAASSTVTLSSSADPVTAGQSVALTATVNAVAPGFGLPTGTVYFLSGNSVVGSVPLFNGSASFSMPAFSSGRYSLEALYSGDGDFYGATSAPLLETINPNLSGGSQAQYSLPAPGNTPSDTGTSSASTIQPAASAGSISPESNDPSMASRGNLLAVLFPPGFVAASANDVAVTRAAMSTAQSSTIPGAWPAVGSYGKTISDVAGVMASGATSGGDNSSGRFDGLTSSLDTALETFSMNDLVVS